MSKRWLALVLAGLMSLVPCLGMAEESAGFDAAQVQPLLDAVATAALNAPEELRELGGEDAMPSAFLSGLLAALEDNGLSTDPEAVSGMFAMALPEFTDAADVTPATMSVLTTDISEDGDAVMLVGAVIAAGSEDQNAVVELHQDEASPVGWKLYRFSLSNVQLIEDVTGGYFAATMVEYLNSACGYSIQYPAIFGEDLVVETASGVQAELADGTASFSVMRLDNTDHLTLDALLAAEQEADPTAEVSSDELTGSGKSVITDEEGITHVAIFLVSEQYIYQAELNYAQDQAEQYAPYVDYMINSFSADELGLG